MTKVLAVLGATGQQGSSVVNHVINDDSLAKTYKIRALTRNVNSDQARKLKEKVEVVEADIANRSSLEKAFDGVHTLFLMNAAILGENAVKDESALIKSITDVAVERGVQHVIFSTLPHVTNISGGKYKAVTAFDAKAEGEQYIRSLPIKSSFYCPGSFMENFSAQAFLAPQPDPEQDGRWIMRWNMAPNTKMPLIDSVGDGGKFVGAILAEPEKYYDKTVFAATRFYTLQEIAAALSKSSGKTIAYKKISDEEFAETLPTPISAMFVDYFKYIEEFGYYGPNAEMRVTKAAANARGKLSTLDEYLEAHPFELV